MTPDAFEFAREQLAKSRLNQFGAGAFLTDRAIQKYQIITHEVRQHFDYKLIGLWFEVTEENATKMTEDSGEDANAWDCSRGIFCANLLNAKPIPKPLRDYVICILLGLKRRPRASEKYNNEYRNKVLSTVIFCVYMLYDKTERDACDIVKRAAQKCNVHTPNSLKAIWHGSEVKKHKLPERTLHNKLLLLEKIYKRIE